MDIKLEHLRIKILIAVVCTYSMYIINIIALLNGNITLAYEFKSNKALRRLIFKEMLAHSHIIVYLTCILHAHVNVHI